VREHCAVQVWVLPAWQTLQSVVANASPPVPLLITMTELFKSNKYKKLKPRSSSQFPPLAFRLCVLDPCFRPMCNRTYSRSMFQARVFTTCFSYLFKTHVQGACSRHMFWIPGLDPGVWSTGLWMWSTPIPQIAPDGSKHHLVLLDTEGIDAYDQVPIYMPLCSALCLSDCLTV
jgi:hypothetical protein